MARPSRFLLHSLAEVAWGAAWSASLVQKVGPGKAGVSWREVSVGACQVLLCVGEALSRCTTVLRSTLPVYLRDWCALKD